MLQATPHRPIRCETAALPVRRIVRNEMTAPTATDRRVTILWCGCDVSTNCHGRHQ